MSSGTYSRGLLRPASQSSTVLNGVPICIEKSFLDNPVFSLSVLIFSADSIWCGDSSVEPYLTTEYGRKRKVYIIALIDDASRFIVGIDVFFNDNFVNLMSVIKSAICKEFQRNTC